MTALHFGSLVLGAGLFGETADRDESFAVLDAFVDAGGRAIDTSDAYSVWVPGHSGGESIRASSACSMCSTSSLRFMA
jgi:aryl-alcohol dehydrogenase-like predicted oxidoreductase